MEFIRQPTEGSIIYNMFHVYAIHNYKAGRVYIGQTDAVERRIKEHNSKKGKHFTARFEGEWVLIYKESLPTRSEAIKREKQLKTSRGRVYISKYIPDSSGNIPG